MARRSESRRTPDVLSPEEIKDLRHRIAHLSPDALVIRARLRFSRRSCVSL